MACTYSRYVHHETDRKLKNDAVRVVPQQLQSPPSATKKMTQKLTAVVARTKWLKKEEGVGLGVWGSGRGYSISCMAVVMYDHRPSHPNNAGMENVGFSPTRRNRRCLLASKARAKRSVRCSASRMKGELRPTKNLLSGGCAYG